MPINYNLYPKNWKTEIRPAILQRAKNCCENCNVPNYAVGFRDEQGAFNPTRGNIVHDLAGQGLSYPSLNPLSYQEAKEVCDVCNSSDLGEKYIVIVLTIAHLDHDVSNNDFDNLAALCQKCHLSHDETHHRANRRKTVNLKKGLVELF